MIEKEKHQYHIFVKHLNYQFHQQKRIIFHEQAKPAIRAAIANPTRINMDTVNAQLARQVLDLLVGFTISPILWKHISRNTEGSLSAEDVNPALRLVYEQQKLINESPGRKVYDTTGIFTKKDIGFTLNYNHDEEEKMVDFLEESANFEHKYNITKLRETTKSSPILTTSALQQKASNEFNFFSKTNYETCNKTLYENGHITYMRTDSKKHSKEFEIRQKNI